jgi:hypothetical protein
MFFRNRRPRPPRGRSLQFDSVGYSWDQDLDIGIVHMRFIDPQTRERFTFEDATEDMKRVAKMLCDAVDETDDDLFDDNPITENPWWRDKKPPF